MLIYSDLFWFILIYSDLFWFILIYSDLFWLILIYSDLFWFILIYSERCKRVKQSEHIHIPWTPIFISAFAVTSCQQYISRSTSVCVVTCKNQKVENLFGSWKILWSTGFLNVHKKSKIRQLFLAQGTPKTDNFALFVKIMTQIAWIITGKFKKLKILFSSEAPFMVKLNFKVRKLDFLLFFAILR